MTGEEVVNASWPSLVDVSKAVWRLVRRQWKFLLLVAGMTCASYVGWEWYRASFSKEIIVLAGPPGSSGWWMATRIAASIRNTDRVPGVRFAVRVDGTNGLYDMIERVRNSQEGNIVGFDQDRSDHAKDLRTLLPLDYDYLHVLCRTGLLVDEGLESPVYHFETILPHVRPARVFAGPPDSGTRHLAELICDRYHFTEPQFEQLLKPAIVDWKQARAALQNDDVDIVFYMGPIGATTIQEIADDQSAVLLDLSDIHESLPEHDKSSLWPVSFPRNAYTAVKWPRTRRAADAIVLWPTLPAIARLQIALPSLGKFQFCPTDVHTFAVRRLLVCPPAMSPNDAYLIGQAAQSELADVGAFVGKWEPVPPRGVSAVAPRPLGIPAHPGAIEQPTQWLRIQTWPSLLASTVTALLLVALKSLSAAIHDSIGQHAPAAPLQSSTPDRAAQPSDSKPPADVAPGIFDGFMAEINKLGESMGQKKTEDGLGLDDDWQECQTKLTSIRESINESQKEGRLQSSEFKELTERLKGVEESLGGVRSALVAAPTHPA